MTITGGHVSRIEAMSFSGRSPVHRLGARIQLATSTGAGALGDALPLPGFSPDRGDRCVDALRTWCTEHTPTPVPDDIAMVSSLLETIPGELPAARFALETALLQLVARHRGTSVAELLGPIGPRRWAAVVAMKNPRDSALAAIEMGAAALKFKVGHEDENVLGAAQRLRSAGVKTPFRIDANQRWSLGMAHKYLPRWHEVGVEFVEEPVPADQRPRLRTEIPVALDESATRAAANSSALDDAAVLIVKPMLHGGILACHKLAQASGKPAVASHLFDTAIGLGACCELACALDNDYAHGVGCHPGLASFSDPAPTQIRGAEVVSTRYDRV